MNFTVLAGGFIAAGSIGYFLRPSKTNIFTLTKATIIGSDYKKNFTGIKYSWGYQSEGLNKKVSLVDHYVEPCISYNGDIPLCRTIESIPPDATITVNDGKVEISHVYLGEYPNPPWWQF